MKERVAVGRPLKVIDPSVFDSVCDLKKEGEGARKIGPKTGLDPSFVSLILKECDNPAARARRTGLNPVTLPSLALPSLAGVRTVHASRSTAPVNPNPVTARYTPANLPSTFITGQPLPYQMNGFAEPIETLAQNYNRFMLDRDVFDLLGEYSSAVQPTVLEDPIGSFQRMTTSMLNQKLGSQMEDAADVWTNNLLGIKNYIPRQPTSVDPEVEELIERAKRYLKIREHTGTAEICCAEKNGKPGSPEVGKGKISDERSFAEISGPGLVTKDEMSASVETRNSPTVNSGEMPDKVTGVMKQHGPDKDSLKRNDVKTETTGDEIVNAGIPEKLGTPTPPTIPEQKATNRGNQPAPPIVPDVAPLGTAGAIVGAQSNLKQPPAKEQSTSSQTTPPPVDNLSGQPYPKNDSEGPDLPAESNANGAVNAPRKVGRKDEGIGSSATSNTPGVLTPVVDSNSCPVTFQPVLLIQNVNTTDTGMLGRDGLKQKIMEQDRIDAPSQDQPASLLRQSGAGAIANGNDDRDLKILGIVAGVAVGVLIFEPYLMRWIYKAFPKTQQQSQPQTELQTQTQHVSLYSVQPSPPESWKTVF